MDNRSAETVTPEDWARAQEALQTVLPFVRARVPKLSTSGTALTLLRQVEAAINGDVSTRWTCAIPGCRGRHANSEGKCALTSKDALYRTMLDDVMAWGRAGYPAVACGRYKDAAELIHRQSKQIEQLQRDIETGFMPGAYARLKELQEIERKYYERQSFETPAFQDRVCAWAVECFGWDDVKDIDMRTLRFLEEALELAQACGCSKSTAMQVLEYVYGRPSGVIAQEVGGTLVSLAVLCRAFAISMERCGEEELTRVLGKVAEIRVRHAAKPNFGLPEKTFSAQLAEKSVEHFEAQKTEAHDATCASLIQTRPRLFCNCRTSPRNEP